MTIENNGKNGSKKLTALLTAFLTVVSGGSGYAAGKNAAVGVETKLDLYVLAQAEIKRDVADAKKEATKAAAMTELLLKFHGIKLPPEVVEVIDGGTP